MSLKVIGAGFGRTGTHSFKIALEMLGFAPCHHMVEVFAHPEQVPLWDKAVRGAMTDWNEIFAPYKASCDWPSCAYYKELAGFYPDAKIVLTLRDPKSWYRSVAETIMPHFRKIPGSPPNFAQLLISEQTFHDDLSEANMIAVFERHNAEVRRVIPRDRLLVFEAKEGWEPLCRFLDVPVPATPYPRTNTTEEFQARIAASGAPPL